MTPSPQAAMAPHDRDLPAGPGALLRLLGMGWPTRSAIVALLLFYLIHQRDSYNTRLLGGLLPAWEPTPEGVAWLLVVLVTPVLAFDLSTVFDRLRRTNLSRCLTGLRRGVRRGLLAILLGVGGAGFLGGLAVGMTPQGAVAFGSVSASLLLLLFGGWEALDRAFLPEWIELLLPFLLLLLPMGVFVLAPELPSALGELPPWLPAGISLGLCALLLHRLGDPLVVIGPLPSSRAPSTQVEGRSEGAGASPAKEDAAPDPTPMDLPSGLRGRIRSARIGRGRPRGIPFPASEFLAGAALALVWGILALLLGNGLVLLLLLVATRLEFAPAPSLHAILPLSRRDRARRAWVQELIVAVGIAGVCGLFLAGASLLAPGRLWGLGEISPFIPAGVILGLAPLVGGLGARLEHRGALSPGGWLGPDRLGALILVLVSALLAPALVLLLHHHLAGAPWPLLGAVVAGVVLVFHALAFGLLRLHYSRCALGPPG